MNMIVKFFTIFLYLNYLFINAMEIRKYPQGEPSYNQVIRVITSQTPDNISFSLHTAQQVCKKMCDKQIDLNNQNEYMINSINGLRCMRSFFAIQSELFSNDLSNYDAMCVTLNRLNITSFQQVHEILNLQNINTKQVVHLDLNFNEIEKIEEDDLADFCNLQVLKLSYNKIKKIHKNAIGKTKISILELTRNELKKIAPFLTNIAPKILRSEHIPFIINASDTRITETETNATNEALGQFSNHGFDLIKFFDVNTTTLESRSTMLCCIFKKNAIKTAIKKIHLSYLSTDTCLKNLIKNNQGIIECSTPINKNYRITKFKTYFANKNYKKPIFSSSQEQTNILCYLLYYLKQTNNQIFQNYILNNKKQIYEILKKYENINN